jgi:phytanoyl-CoA hydroxylase
VDDGTPATARRIAFDTDGFVVVKGFSESQECDRMRARMHELVEAWDPAGELVGFATREQEQERAQGSSDYFLDSADRCAGPPRLGL